MKKKNAHETTRNRTRITRKNPSREGISARCLNTHSGSRGFPTF